MEYGVTDQGFVLKRADDIMEEVHTDLSEGFKFDTRQIDGSFLDVIVTSFCGQIAELWEEAQEKYYSISPATANGLNLDNAVQYGNISRKPSEPSIYPLHCTGDDGTVVPEGTIVSTDTKPEVELYNKSEFVITREAFNSARIKVAVVQALTDYTVTIQGVPYVVTSEETTDENSILSMFVSTITNEEYTVSIEETEDGVYLVVEDNDERRNNVLGLSENLTTETVTTVHDFQTSNHGKIVIPDGLIVNMVTDVPGFTEVVNKCTPTYGRDAETDTELRNSYANKVAMQSSTMVESIEGYILENVEKVESATGYQNDYDYVNERGLPPHTIEMVVEGGNETEIAEAILKKKAGGIPTYGDVSVFVKTRNGDTVEIRFNRPSYLYVWMKVIIHGDTTIIPDNFATLTQGAILTSASDITTGEPLLIQLLTQGIYDTVAGVNYIDIMIATTEDESVIPGEDEYVHANVVANTRQKIVVDSDRIEVSLDGSA